MWCNSASFCLASYQYEDAQDAQALVCVYAPNPNLYADLAKGDPPLDHELTDRERYHDHTYFEHDKEESANGYTSDADCECHRCHASFQCDKKVSAGGYKSSLVVIIHGYELQWAFWIFQYQHECVDQNVIYALVLGLFLNGHGVVIRVSLSVTKFEDAHVDECGSLCDHSYLSYDHHCNHGYKYSLLKVDFYNFLLNVDFYNFLLNDYCDNSLERDSCG